MLQDGKAEYGRVAPIHDVGPRRLRMVAICWCRSASGGASARCGVSGGTSVGRTVSSWTECPSASGRRYRVHSEKLKVLPYDIYVSACFNSRNSLSCK